MDTKVVVIDREKLGMMANAAENSEAAKEAAAVWEAADREKLDALLLEAAQILRSGGLVAFPTETVYGLGANGLDDAAARKIYAAKGRPSDNPLILHISKEEELTPLVREVPEAARKLMKAFWPGPLTMIFSKSSIVPYGTTGGLDTVAVRMPSDPIANRMIALAGVPVAAPSANLSGRPSPTTANHVIEDMNGRIEMILDGGPVGIGVESTIVDVTGPVPMLLRPGAVTMEMLQDAIGETAVDPAITGPVAADVRPKAPGMKYRHYAPKAELVLVEERGQGSAGEALLAARALDETGEARIPQGPGDAVVRMINRLAGERLSEGYAVGILCTDETKNRYPQGVVRSVGLRGQEETIAHSLFAVLREFDDLGVDYIYSESFSRDHLGQAIMNRLTKAAGYHIIYTDEKKEGKSNE